MDAIEDIRAERTRQIFVEGIAPGDDDRHSEGELAKAAACYAAPITLFRIKITADWHGGDRFVFRNVWPWASDMFKPKDRRRDLVRAGALIAAEIERLDRLAAHAHQETEAA